MSTVSRDEAQRSCDTGSEDGATLWPARTRKADRPQQGLPLTARTRKARRIAGNGAPHRPCPERPTRRHNQRGPVMTVDVTGPTPVVELPPLQDDRLYTAEEISPYVGVGPRFLKRAASADTIQHT